MTKTTTATSRRRVVEWAEPGAKAADGLAMGGLAYLRAMANGEVEVAAIGRLMDFTVKSVEEGRVVFAVEPAEFHCNPLGAVHGGLAATLIDSASGCAIHTLLPPGVGFTTIDLTTNFVRPMTPGMGEVTCEGTVIHLGRTVGRSEAKLVGPDGKLIAYGHSTCHILRPAKP
ncbi:MAG: PaaI family thioesterase [Alphaproteobacteria bacterium]